MVEVVESQSVGDTPQPRPHIHLVSDRSERDSFNKKKNFEFQLFFDSTNKTKQCQSNRHSIAGSVGYAGTCTTSSSHLDKNNHFSSSSSTTTVLSVTVTLIPLPHAGQSTGTSQSCLISYLLLVATWRSRPRPPSLHSYGHVWNVVVLDFVRHR